MSRAQGAAQAGDVAGVESFCAEGVGALQSHLGDECSALRLRIEITRSWSVLEREGLEGCLAHLSQVVDEAKARQLKVVAVLATAQSAMMLARCHEPRRAWELFCSLDSDIGELTPIDRLKLRINRSSAGTLAQEYAMSLRELQLAREDLREVDDVNLEVTLGSNVAYLHHLLGRHVEALREMTQIRSLPSTIDSIALDTQKAKVLVQLGLVFEARDLLSETVSREGAEVEPVKLAAPYLELSWVCQVLGDLEASLEHARRAKHILGRVGASAWLLRVELALLITRMEGLRKGWGQFHQTGGQSVTDSAANISRTAGDLESTALAHGSAYVRARSALVQAELAMHLGDYQAVQAHLGRCRSLSESGLLTSRLAHIRVQAWLADCLGDVTTRDELLAAAAQDYAEQALTTASLDIRLAAATHVSELSKLDVAIGVLTGNAMDTLQRMERWRVAWLGGGILTPSDASLSDKLAALRQARKQLSEAGNAEEHEKARESIRSLEQQVRDNGWLKAASTSVPVAPASSEEVRMRLSQEMTCLCAFISGGTEISAVLINPNGRSCIRKIGHEDEIAEAIERVRTDWHAYLVVSSSGQPSSAMVETVQRSLEFSLQELDRMLLEPLGCQEKPMVITPCLNLADVPWGALPSRRGKATTLSRSASAWTYAAQRVPRRPAGAPLRIAAACGPGLEYASGEVDRIAQAWHRPAKEIASGCTSSEVKHALRESDVVSLAVHGHHDLRNPLFSTLHLEDGVTSAHDFLPEDVRASLVFVSACEGGRVTRRVGDEMWGLVAALLGAGVRTVVAPTAKVPDNQAMQCMARTHQLLAQGVDVATAVAQATAAVDLSAGSFVVYGGPWSTKAILENRANVGAVRSSCGLAVTA